MDACALKHAVTLVEDSTHISETGDLPTGTGTAHIEIGCGIANGAAVCTESLELDGQSTTLELTTAVSLQGLNVGGSVASTTSTSQSVLGPSISTSGSTTSTSTATVTTPTTSTTPSSGAMRGMSAELPLGGVVAVVAAVLAHVL